MKCDTEGLTDAADLDAVDRLRQDPGTFPVVRTGDNAISRFAVLPSVEGTPILLVRVELPREIHRRGQATLRYIAAALGLIGVGCMLLTLLLVRRHILSPLTGLSADVNRIAGSGDVSARVAIAGSDEVATLASNIDQMLEAVERSQRDRMQSEERFRLAAQATNDVIWDWDLESGRIEWSDTVLQHFGCTREQLGDRIEDFEARVHPDDRARAAERLQAAIETGAESGVEGYRFRRQDGSYAVVLDRGYIARDEMPKDFSTRIPSNELAILVDYLIAQK